MLSDYVVLYFKSILLLSSVLCHATPFNTLSCYTVLFCVPISTVTSCFNDDVVSCILLSLCHVDQFYIMTRTFNAVSHRLCLCFMCTSNLNFPFSLFYVTFLCNQTMLLRELCYLSILHVCHFIILRLCNVTCNFIC